MIRVGVYNGDTHKRGLTLHNFTVLHQLEDTESSIDEFNLVGRYLNFKEHLMKNRIYLVNIQDEDPSKPAIHFEVLDKAKFIKYLDGDFIITYKRYGNQSMIDLYEARTEEFEEYLDWVVKRGKEKDGKRTRLNTFTKSIVDRIFRNYGYNNVIQYDDKNELRTWQKSILDRVKNFNKQREDEKTNWSEEELDLLILEMSKPPEDRMSEKQLAAKLGRTVPSIATKKWKLKSETYKTKYFNMEDRAKLISDKLKSFREEKGWAQGKLSKESGVSLSIVNQLECMNYSNTETSKVNELLEFIVNNSEHIILTDLPKQNEIAHNQPAEREKVTERKAASVPNNNSELESRREIRGGDINEVLRELKHLSLKIDNILQSHVTLKIENSKIKNDKENLLRVLTNYISESSLEQKQVV
jgi:transcriptional regulator with XRE-family HTH domain